MLFQNHYIFYTVMSNPFACFADDEEEQKYTPVSTEQKPKRTHAEKRVFKQQQQVYDKSGSTANPVYTEERPAQKDSGKDRNPRHPPTPLTKKLGEGHFHDKRSGTGRIDKPRKAGGGRGNIGNTKDDLNQDKYIKDTPEENGAVNEEPKPEEVVAVPEEPQAPTLEEYYKSKGVDMQGSFAQKGPSKKNNINAEWIKKEKLTVIQTKEDKKNIERNGQNLVKFSDTRASLDDNLEALGFNSKPTRKAEDKKDQKSDYKGKVSGKGKKVALSKEDFPSL